jgi:hypothetical protein
MSLSLLVNFVSVALLSLVMTSAFAANNYSCDLDETSGDQQQTLPLTLDLTQRIAGSVSFTTPGKSSLGSISLNQQNPRGRTADRATISFMDPYTQKPVKATYAADPGYSSRLMLLHNPKNADRIEMNCMREGTSSSDFNPQGLKCTMTEYTASSKYTTPFEVAVASNGHDTTLLPKAVLANVDGWVMAYNGIIITYLQNPKISTGVTAMGHWESPVTLQWSPDKDQSITVLIDCEAY